MTTTKPIHFFDIDSVLPGPNRSWSSSTPKIRMVLNYKSIPYKQSFISYPDIAPLLKSFSVTPHSKGRMQYTLPAVCHPESVTANAAGAEWFGRPLSELAVTGKDEMRRVIDAMKAELGIFVAMLAGAEGKQGPYLKGKSPGYADFVLVTFLSWSHRVDMDIWREIMSMGNGELRALWDACLPLMEGQGEQVEWPALQE